ncbi:hypothetical protein [Arthrobacter sp. STN4]|uniref:hypothetical protein n=1 Tax=Arthrobacter sp. STN4 TaxID=2923276 RepID=UPI00211A0D06|nr:hypothetical protein [Arthrobacter sp. STN4]MCQ9162940.1 hypothetical protein [Arthrobacter sp. STN4]
MKPAVASAAVAVATIVATGIVITKLGAAAGAVAGRPARSRHLRRRIPRHGKNPALK